MDEECEYDAETGSCRYCHKNMTKENSESNFQASHKNAEDMFSASTQELLKHLRETYPKYWKKVVDYAQEYLQEKDVKGKKIKQETDHNEWNTKMSYQLVVRNGVQDYQEVVFPGLLTENQERTILCFSQNRKFYPSVFHFPY